MHGNETSVLIQQQERTEFSKARVAIKVQHKSETSRQSKMKPENIHIHHPSAGQESSSDCCEHDPDSYVRPAHSVPSEKQLEEARSHRSTTPAPTPQDPTEETSQEAKRRRPEEEDCTPVSDASQGDVSSEGCSKSSAATTTGTATVTEKIDTALHTLKSELMAMREQDLQLLKQLIHINDNIRRLKRARWLQRGGARTVSCGLLGVRTHTNAAPVPPGAANNAATSTTTTSCAAGSGPFSAASRGGAGGCGVSRVSMLTRQRSEPGLLGVPHFARTAGPSLTSTSSSFETIEDEDEEADSLYGSFSDLPSDTSPASSPFSPTKPPSLPATPLARTFPSAYTSLTFTQEELWRGESSYGEILKRNVRLWKWSVAREREKGVVDANPGHPCVL